MCSLCCSGSTTWCANAKLTSGRKPPQITKHCQSKQNPSTSPIAEPFQKLSALKGLPNPNSSCHATRDAAVTGSYSSHSYSSHSYNSHTGSNHSYSSHSYSIHSYSIRSSQLQQSQLLYSHSYVTAVTDTQQPQLYSSHSYSAATATAQPQLQSSHSCQLIMPATGI